MRAERPDKLPELVLLQPEVFEDSRGFFLETWNASRYEEVGIDADFVQDNRSRSHLHVLRGLHFQYPHAQGKLVTVTRGRAFDVAVDVRVGSATYGRWLGVELTDENHQQLWIPEGFAHGFLALSETVDILYKCTDHYHPEAEHTLVWNDTVIEVAWPIRDPILSAKDSNGRTLAELKARSCLPRFGP